MKLHAVRLLPRFAPEQLRHDLSLLADTARKAQPGRYHDGSWQGISLFNQGADHQFAGTVKHGSKVLRPYPTALLEKTTPEDLRAAYLRATAPKPVVRVDLSHVTPIKVTPPIRKSVLPPARLCSEMAMTCSWK